MLHRGSVFFFFFPKDFELSNELLLASSPQHSASHILSIPLSIKMDFSGYYRIIFFFLYSADSIPNETLTDVIYFLLRGKKNCPPTYRTQSSTCIKQRNLLPYVWVFSITGVLTWDVLKVTHHMSDRKMYQTLCVCIVFLSRFDSTSCAGWLHLRASSSQAPTHFCHPSSCFACKRMTQWKCCKSK